MARTPSVNDHAQANRAVIIPQTQTQKAYLRSIESNPQTFVLGPAGTGKTFLPSAVAARMFLRGQIDKIVLTRPRVEVDEEWGHLPGNLQMKTAPWAYPITEVLEEYMGKARYLQATKDGQIEVLPLAFMRGRTLERCFTILDEAQNTTVRQMKMFVTRIGKDSRVVVNGDVAQKDLPSHTDCGLAWALRMLEVHSSLPAELIEFTADDVVRSDACAAWIKAMTETPDGVLAKVQGCPQIRACK